MKTIILTFAATALLFAQAPSMNPWTHKLDFGNPAIQADQARYRMIGSIIGANMNSTADQAITVAAPIGTSRKYIVRRVIVVNASTSLTLAVGGVYSAASKGGSAIVANTQVYTALTAAAKFLDLTLAAIALSDVRTEATLYLSLTTAQGGAATADLYIFAEDIS